MDYRTWRSFSRNFTLKMNINEFNIIIESQKNLQGLSNSQLTKFMDLLSEDFEKTKEELFKLTYHLDQVEEVYNKILREYQNRL